MPIILGVDAGNSKTLAAVSDGTGCALGIGRSGGGNHQSNGMDAALGEIRAAMNDALLVAGLTSSDVDATFLALAGADLEEDFVLLRSAVATLGIFGPWEIDNDCMAGLRAGTDRPDAVVVIAGSGTNAAGRNAAGESIRLPGLGWISGDWGGGGELAREAISLVVRAWDGRGSPTALSNIVLKHLGQESVDSMIAAMYHRRISAAQIHALVPLIFAAAHDGDPEALRLIERQADEVATTAGALIRRLGMAERECDVALAGSVFRERTGRLVSLVRSRLGERYPEAHVVISDLEPVLGSVLCGFDLLDLETGEQVRRNLVSSFTELQAKGVQVAAS